MFVLKYKMEYQVAHIKLVDAEEIRPLRHLNAKTRTRFSTTSYDRDNEEGHFSFRLVL